MTSFFEHLPKRLRDERIRLGLSQQDFATLGGISLRSQSRNENNVADIDVEYFDRLSMHGVDVLYVLTGIRSGVNAENTLNEMAPPRYKSEGSTPPELQPVVSALINLWLSRTLTTDTLDSWREMFDRMNPFLNPQAARTVTPQPVTHVIRGDDVTRSDPNDLTLFSRKPG